MANENIQEVGVKFTAEGAVEYQRTLKEINADMAQNSAEYQRTTAEIGKNATATEKLTAKAQLYEKQVELQKQKVATLNSELDALTSAEDKNEDAIAKKRKELTQAETTLTKYESTLKDVNDELKNHTQWTDKASEKLKDIGGKMESAGKKASVASAGIVAIGAASVMAFNEVDEGLDTIVKKTGATGDAFGDLEQSFKNVYGSIPTTAQNAGIAIGEVNTRFHSTGKELEDLSGLFLKFAEINETDLNGSIGKTNRLMQQWNLDNSQTANVLGLVTSEAQRTGISVDTLMDSVQKNTATFREMGLSFDQSVVLLSNFEANGVNAEVALAGLRKSAVAYTKQGLTMEQGIAKTIDAIKNAKTGTEALAIAQEVFGTKGALEMSNAIRDGRLSVEDLTTSMQSMGSVVSDTFEATLDAPDKMAVALNNAKMAGADLGATIFEMLTPAIEWITELVRNLAAWFGGLDDSQKQTIVTIGLVIAAIGPLLIILGKLTSGRGYIIEHGPQILDAFSGIGKAFTSLMSTIAAHPVITIITAIVAAVIYLYTQCEWFRDGVNDILRAVGQFFVGLWNSVKSVFNGIRDVFMMFLNLAKSILIGQITAVISSVTGVFSSLWESIKAIFENIKGVFTGIIDFVRNVFTGNWRGAWDSVVKIFGNIFGALSGFVKAPINAVISLINGAIAGINRISITVPDWVPALGGKKFGFSIPNIPMLAAGGDLVSGMAIVAEAGPELIQRQGSKTRVTPLSGSGKNSALSDVGLSDETIEKLAAAIVRALRGNSDGGDAPSVLQLLLNGKEMARALLPFISQLLAMEQVNLSTARGDVW